MFYTKINLFKKTLIDLRSRLATEREGERDRFSTHWSMLLKAPTDGWARPKLGAWTFIRVSYMVAWGQVLGPSSTIFPGTLTGRWIRRRKQLELKPGLPYGCLPSK